MTGKEMVEKFLCPGCVCGHSTMCGRYENNGADSTMCANHVLGTVIMPYPGHIALGMPKGFNRPGPCSNNGGTHNKMQIRLWPKDKHGNVSGPRFDHFNIAVWALEKDGFLFIRTAMPRLAAWFVDVVEGGSYWNDCGPRGQAINAASIGEFD